MLKPLQTLYIVLLCLCLPAWSGASEVPDLFETEVAVKSQLPQERKTAIHDGLLTVLIKATGNSEIALAPGVAQLIDRSQQLVQQYRYRVEQLPNPGGTTPLEQLWLWLRYDEVAIVQALQQLGIPTWARTRPGTLVWLALEAGGRRRLVDEQDNELRSLLNREAARRGVPLVLPLMDLEDQRHIKVSDVWGNFQDNIAVASSRYDADAILTGRLRALDAGRDEWEVRWTYSHTGIVYNWGQSGSLQTVIANGIDGVADTLASKYVLNTGSQLGEVLVLVTGIKTVEDYARSDAFLRNFDPVTDVQATRVWPDKVLFTVILRGDRQLLGQLIRLSDKHLLDEVSLPPELLPQPGQPAQVKSIADVVYELLP
jgi:hypothetical protein